MFILDSLFISGFRWVLDTVVTAADAERNDDSALREQLLAAEMRREMGEISDEEFAELESDLLARIREIKERREGGSGPIAFGNEPIETEGSQLAVEATVSGDFHEPPPNTDSGTVIDGPFVRPAGEGDEPPAVRSALARARQRTPAPVRRTHRKKTRRTKISQ
jgi:hypothetical protein